MRRRQFIGQGMALAATMAGGLPAAAAPTMLASGRHGPGAIPADRLLAAHPLPQSLAAIGMAARRQAGARGAACPTCLRTAFQDLLAHLDWSEAELRLMSPAAILERIRTGTARDFALGRTLLVGGWLLGETEVRLCAVAALRVA